MTSAKKIMITTESHEIFILRGNNVGRAFDHCVQCGRGVDMLSIDRAVSASGMRTDELIKRIFANEIHGIETESGRLLICAGSLPVKSEVKGVEE